MGASDSKLVFKQGIFRLSEQGDIPADDAYWTGFWTLPESPSDIFTLFSPADIRRTRDNALGNLETLILAVSSRLFALRNHRAFPDPEAAPERDALNCIRILTRLLPFIYEKETIEEWEEQFFWGRRRRRKRRMKDVSRRRDPKNEVLFDDSASPAPPTAESPHNEDQELNSQQPTDEFEDAKPLAEELIDTLIDLLFFSSFTLPPSAGKPKVPYSIWQSGVGCHTSILSTKEYESNRAEILRLLLVLCSKALYMRPEVTVAKGVRSITYLTTCEDKQIVLSVLCSLLNTCLKWNPATWSTSALRMVPVEQLGLTGTVGAHSRELLVTYCIQFLLTLILYPIPEIQHGIPPKNVYRHFLGRLHRPQDFQFLVDGMTRILNQPLHRGSTYIPGSGGSKVIQPQAPEMLMLFWETLQSNKRFRSFIIDTDRSHDFLVVTLFYAMEYRNDSAKQGIVRMCVFILQTMSVEGNFGKSLNKRFEGQETLPPSIRIPNFHGSYADFLITSIHDFLTTKHGTSQRNNIEAIYPALLAILNNIAPYVENLARATSSKLMQLFATMARPEFLLANESNYQYLQSLLEALNAVVEHQFSKNSNLVYAIFRSKRQLEALREFTLESGQEELARLQKEKDAATSSKRAPGSRGESMDSVLSPTTRTGTGLSNVPEEQSAFGIGDDDEDEENQHEETRLIDHSQGPSQSHGSSRAASVSSAVDDVPPQLRGMSEKARGKMPAGTPSFSRQNSMSSLHSLSQVPSANVGSGSWQPTAGWLDSWLPNLPLHTMLTLTQDLTSLLPPLSLESRDSQTSTEHTLSSIRRINPKDLHIDPSPIRIHLFEWSPLALGWYLSLLWGFIFQAESAISKGTSGVWSATGETIKMFRVQEGGHRAPSLLNPRGAVDAVGANLVGRVQSLNLGSIGRSVSGGRGQPTVRDV